MCICRLCLIDLTQLERERTHDRNHLKSTNVHCYRNSIRHGVRPLLPNLTLKVPSRLRVLEAKVCQSLRSTHGDVMDVLRDNEATEAREVPLWAILGESWGQDSPTTDQMDMDRIRRRQQVLQRIQIGDNLANPILPLLSTSGSRQRSRSPAGKGKDNGKSMDKDKGMDKGKDKGKGMGKGMDKGKVSLELQRARAVLELRQKMEHVFCRAQGKTLAALQLEVLDAVTPLLEQQVNYALTDID